ncbi:hypothetical protein [Haloferula sp.]|uniref:hypothetical protein n=1 Tax=Haloferula sp. TaxID=2497595 RepID=UPI00329B394C
MSSPSSDGQELHELKHEAVPGYMKVFVIGFALMAIYLAVILASSPGKVEYHKKGHEDGKGSAEEQH